MAMHGARGQRFCILHAPQPGPTGSARGAVVYVHPFAEEMNKSRRMAALQARALARQGFAVLQIDLLGCGDSSGDFADATWQDWLADVAEAASFLQRRFDAPLWLWGLRAGCLLAAQAAAELPGPCHFLFWQAPASGKALLQQFLRLKVAGNMLDGKAKGAMEVLRAQLEAGRAVEVAGYTLGAALARGLEGAVLQPPAGAARLEWMDVSSLADAALAPAALRVLSQWRAAGCSVAEQIVAGPAFWHTTEIETAPTLIDAGCRALAVPLAEGVAA